jgi:hypothetical protein
MKYSVRLFVVTLLILVSSYTPNINNYNLGN